MSTTLEQRVPLTLAAQRLRVGYHRCRDMVLRGDLAGEQTGGKWFVDGESLERLERERGIH